MRLAELCDIHSTYTARGKLVPLAEGGVPALQLSNVVAGDVISPSRLQRFDLPKLPDRHYVRGGEVVFRSRGNSTIAMAIPDNLAEAIAVIMPVLIIRPDRNRILPEYMAWAINQPAAQHKLAMDARESSLRMIPLPTLKNLDIPVPDLATQKKIADLDTLSRQEGRLLRRLAKQRERLISALLAQKATDTKQKEPAQ